MRLQPDSADSLIGLGIAQMDQGKTDDAIANIERALQLKPHSASYYNLAKAWVAKGDFARAIGLYQEAIRLQPNDPKAVTNLGIAQAQAGRLVEAIGTLEYAVCIWPDYSKAHLNLGVAFEEAGRREDALRCFCEAVRLKPDYVEALYSCGNALVEKKQHAEGIACFEKALALQPNFAPALNNLGLALKDVGRYGEAVIVLRQGARLRPGSCDAHNNLGLALAELGRYTEAETCYHEALRLDPRFADGHANLGSLYKEMGRFDEAIASFQQALWWQPDNASTHWNRALTWLHQGDYERGWPEYEWRWRRKGTVPRTFVKPRWDGTSLEERTILVHMEQGLGDMIQFVRFVPLLKERGAKVILECPGLLASLFQSCAGIDEIVREGESLPEFDIHVPILSLPGLFRTTLASIPGNVPYLFARPELVDRWGQRMQNFGGAKIGIAWQGNVHHAWDHHRSVPLSVFAPLAALPRVKLISLQKGPGADQMGEVQFSVVDYGDQLDDEAGSFQNIAAIMKNLDLVITVDTAIAHLAGALGTPTWVAISTRADWRWLRDRSDSPWYDSLLVFRQQSLDEWNGVFVRMARRLSKTCAF